MNAYNDDYIHDKKDIRPDYYNFIMRRGAFVLTGLTICCALHAAAKIVHQLELFHQNQITQQHSIENQNTISTPKPE